MFAITGTFSALGPDHARSVAGASLRALILRECVSEARDDDAAVCFAGVALNGDDDPLYADRDILVAADARLDEPEDLHRTLRIQPGHSSAALFAHAFRRWGLELVSHVYGDYAVAIWDKAERQLHLIRDPFAQRPLHYARTDRLAAFASLPRGLLAEVGGPRPDMAQLANYVRLEHQLGPRSFYEGVSRVQPGHTVSLGAAAKRSRRYWFPTGAPAKAASTDDLIQAYRFELDAATRRRLPNDGKPVAAHCSAGWDSTAVCATAAKLLLPADRQVIAYTAVPGTISEAPPHYFNDERHGAAAVAACWSNIRHRLVPAAARSALDDMAGWQKVYDRPLGSPCNQVWLGDIRNAANEIGAGGLVTGDLGNWSISASPVTLYAEYLRQGRYRAWAREVVQGVRKRRGRIRGILWNSFMPFMTPALRRPFQPLGSLPVIQNALSSAMEAATPDDVRAELDDLKIERSFVRSSSDWLLRYDSGHARWGAAATGQLWERDVTSDRRLIEFCLALPLDQLLKDGVRRPLARAALSDRLPPEILDRRGKGYQASDWWVPLTRDRGRMLDMLDAFRRSAAADLLDLRKLRTWIEEWPTGGWEGADTTIRYRGALLHALAAGQFILDCEARAREPAPAAVA